MGGRGSSSKTKPRETQTTTQTTSTTTTVHVGGGGGGSPFGQFSFETPSEEEVINDEVEQNEAKDVEVHQETKDGKLDDFGEKIGGARKDAWKEKGLGVYDLAGMTQIEKNKYVTKDNVWKIETNALLDEGYSKEQVVLIKEIKRFIPKNPDYRGMNDEQKADAQRKYVETVNLIKKEALNIKDQSDVEKFLNKVFFDKGLLVIPHGQRSPQVTSEFYKNPAVSVDLYNNINRYKNPYFWSTLENKAKKLQIGVPDEKKLPKGLKVSKFTDGSYGIVKGRYIIETFKTEQEAIDKAQDIGKAVKTQTKKRFIPKQLEHVNREGIDYRKEKDVNGKDYMKTFGFRGGEFGEWMTEKDRKVSMNYGYDALKDLSDVLDIKDKDISFDGKLAIAFGSRGKPGAAAHYEPDRNVINLTKMNGAGSLAHEWFHALDSNISVKVGHNQGTYLTQLSGERLKSVGLSSVNKLINIMKFGEEDVHTWSSETKFYRDSQRFDHIHSKDSGRYWSSTVEMAARAFSSYVSDRTNHKSDYLSGTSEAYVAVEQDKEGNPVLYQAMPVGKERQKINKAFDEMFKELKDKNLI